MRFFLAFVLSFLCLNSLIGCVTTNQNSGASKESMMLEPAGMLKFSDVPVPAGFRAVSQESYSFESAGIRVGLLKYQGKANPDQVVSFYKDQMGMYNWNLLNVVEYGQRMLNFERENETCIVTLLVKGNNITISISVGPKSQALPKKAKDKEKEPIK